MNAQEHAFPEGRSGEINVVFNSDQAKWRLESATMALGFRQTLTSRCEFDGVSVDSTARAAGERQSGCDSRRRQALHHQIPTKRLKGLTPVALYICSTPGQICVGLRGGRELVN